MTVPMLLRVPQVNVNDESVLLVRWSADSGATVGAGDLVCEVETTKAVAEVTAPAGGVLVHSVAVGTRVGVGAPIGAIADTAEAASALLATLESLETAIAGTATTVTATPKARALAMEHGVGIDEVAQRGVRGTVKEADVLAFVRARQAALPAGLERFVAAQGPIPAFDEAIAANLRRSTGQLILTSVDMECRLTHAHARIAKATAAGQMVSVLHLVIAAVARSLPEFPRLTSFAHAGTLYRYQATDVAFVARASDGRLYTPVLRAADTLPVEAIAKAAQAATFRILRGSAKAEELEGAAFTISQVPVPGTTRVVALPSFGQSAILGVSAEQLAPRVVDGAVVPVPVVTFTLNYDHALCDGVYAAGFLAAVVKEMEASAS